ncbi:sigma-70 family RNA polymerase sigma factor [Paracrocinitomix mangrovi]|uniref:RNA polymerase sigma factor n=1 Tax=Paracrocinitomix mangrovi TaxID=2862509 RepID=UPI001C8F09E4|nr:sigma-70 family RNA polymerase sigma factor [Paracrocinitomix mangrovi]UKN01699.1 sigma-70 family RNA polymerase sigma factor [Paracrocinitomix mangrovi]
MTDKELVAVAKENPDAFGGLYERYFEPLFYFIFKRVQDEAAAGDICQKAMMKAMFNIGKFEDRGIGVKYWLYRIASNETNLYFREQKKIVTVEVEDKHVKSMMTEISIGEEGSETDQEKLLKVLSNLKPEHAEIVELRFFMQYSFKEIADFYSVSEATAKMRLYRILEKVKETWEANK